MKYDNAAEKLRDYFQVDNNDEVLVVPHKREESFFLWIPAIILVSVGFILMRNHMELNLEVDETSKMQLLSSAFSNNGEFPDNYTCGTSFDKTDRSLGVSPPLNWINPPEGVQEYAIIMSSNSTDPPQYNWVYYNISKSLTYIDANTTVGRNYKKKPKHHTYDEYMIDGVYQRNGYARPCSEGPGTKWYTFTLYAISDHIINIVPRSDYEANNISADSYVYYLQNYALAVAEINAWSMHYLFTLTPSRPHGN